MIILASRSDIRHQLLNQAGIEHEVLALPIDEDGVKAAMKEAGESVVNTAIELAHFKAYRVSNKNPGRLVLGADQMLEFEQAWFDKPQSLAQAREHLHLFRNKTHRLISALVMVKDGMRIWHTVSTADLTMRDFSDAFLDDYLRSEGETILSSVGAYRLEGKGIQLFRAISGDYHTILGLPLLPLLDFLRNHNEVGR